MLKLKSTKKELELLFASMLSGDCFLKGLAEDYDEISKSPYRPLIQEYYTDDSNRPVD